MVAIVGGTGLGLFNSSLSQLNGFGSTGKGQIGQGRDQAYVNAATGNLVIQGQDDYLASLGLDLAAMRTYNSLGLMDGGNNDGWTLFGSRRLVAPLPAAGGTASVVRINDDGHQATFVNIGTDLWQSTDGSGAHDTLARQANGTWIYTEGSSRATETYDANGRLSNAKDADGNTQTYGYTGSLLTSVTDASGQVTTLAYDANNNLTSIQTSSNGQQAIRVRYVYETQGSLTRLNSVEVDLGNADDTVRDSDTQIFFTKYEYESSSSNRITSLIQGRKNTVGGTLIETARLNVGYVASGTYAGRVQTLTTVTGGTEPNRTLTFNYLSATQTSVTDTLGYVTTYTYDAQNRLTKVEAPLVSGASARSTTQYLYDADGNVSQVITLYENGSNRSTNYTYSGGNLIKIVDQGGNTVERSYDSASQQLVSETVYRTPDTDGAGPLVAADPVVTRYLYDSESHLRFVITPEGRVTEHRYNANGTRSQTRSYYAHAYGGSIFTDTELAKWAGDLLDKTKQGLTLYNYDFRGMISSVVEYSTVDITGNNGTTLATQNFFVYGRSGELLKTVQNNATMQSFYDSPSTGNLSGQLAGVWDFVSGQLRATNKQDATAATPVMTGTTLHQLNANTPTWVFQAELTTGASSNGRETALGISNNVDSVTAAADYRRHLALFSSDRIKAVFNTGTGDQVVDLGFAKDNVTYVVEVVRTTTESKLYVYERGRSREGAGAFVHTVALTAGATAGWDQVKWNLYTVVNSAKSGTTCLIDNMGVFTRLTQTSLAGAAVTTYLYDGLGRVISNTDAIGRTAITDYQDAGNTVVVAMQGGSAPRSTYLTTSTVFNKAGDVVQTIQTGANIATTTTAYDYDSNGRLRMVTDASLGRTHYLYDERGWKIAEVSADMALTEYTYNLAGQLLKTIRYANRVTAALVDGNGEPVAFTLATTGVRTADANNDRSTERVYNPAGQLVYLIDADRFVTEMVYDGAGRVTATIVYDNVLPGSANSWSLIRTDRQLAVNRDDTANRFTRSFYDKDGLLAGTLDAEGCLVEREYDKAGNMVRQTAYALQLPVLSVDLRTLTDLKTLALAAATEVAAKNQTSYMLYDGMNRLIAAIDPEGYLSEYFYDRANNKSEERRYSRPVVYAASKSVADYRTEARAPVLAEPTTALRLYYARQVYVYDAANRVTSEDGFYYTINASNVDASNRIATTVYQYNTQYGYLEKLTLAADAVVATTEQRSTTREYDALGRVKRELGGIGSYVLSQLAPTATLIEREAVWTQYATKYTYDALGRRISATDPNGKTTVYYYDAVGRLRYAINAAGEVSETTYTAFGEVDKTTRYAQRIVLVNGSGVRDIVGGLQTDSVLTSRLASLVTDTNNRVADLDYNKRGLLSKKTDAFGFITDLIYNSFGQKSTVTTDLARTSTLIRRADSWTYDRRGAQIGSVVDSSSGLAIGETLGYDAFGRVVSRTDALGRVWKTEYDKLGRAIQTRDPFNQGVLTTYDAFSRVLTQTNALNQATSYTYDARGKTVTVVTPEGVSTRSNYDRHDVLYKSELLNNGVWDATVYTYDRDGRLTQATDPNTLIEKTEFDAGGRVASTLDKNNIRTSYTYDDAGRLIGRTVDPASYTPPGSSTPIIKANALNLVTAYEYDAFGQTIRTTDPLNVVTETQFDKEGRVTKVITDFGSQKMASFYSYGYYDSGRTMVTVEEGRLGTFDGTNWNFGVALRTTVKAYDKAGRLSREIVDAGSGTNPLTGQAYRALVTDYAYDKNNNLVYRRDPQGSYWRSVYDEANRKTFDVDAMGGVTEYRYDVAGRLAETIRRADRVDLAGMPLVIGTDALRYGTRLWSGDLADTVGLTIPPSQTAVAQDYLGARLTLTAQAVNHVGTIAYGTRNHQIADHGKVAYRAEITVAASTSGEYYAGAEQLGARAHLAMFTGNTIKAYRYTGSTSQEVTLGTLEFGVAYVVEVEVSAGGSQLYIYKKGQSRSSGFSDSLSVTWASAQMRVGVVGNLSSLGEKAYVDNLSEYRVYNDAAPQDRHERRIYDRDGRLMYQIDAQNYVTKSEYDTAGRVIKTTRYATPVVLASTAAVSTLTQVEALLLPAGTGEFDVVESYTFDKGGRLTKTTDANAFITTNGYDSVGRLTSTVDRYGTRTTFTYDAAGRLTTRVVDQGSGINPITRQAYLNLTTRYEYDAAGNQTKLTNAANAITEMAYDSLGRLTSMVVDTADKKLATVYTYDNLGRSKTVSEGIQATGSSGAWNISAAPARITAYLYDGAGWLVSQTVDAGSGTNPATGVAYLNLVTQYSYDKLGNAFRKTDATSKVWSYAYDELGRKVFDVDPLGSLTEYRYDNWGRLTDTLRYAERITLPSSITPDTIRHAVSSTVWSNDLATNTNGLDLTYAGTAFVHESNRLTAISRPGATQNSVQAATDVAISATDKVLIRGTLQLTAIPAGSYMLGALGGNIHAAHISGDRVYAARFTGSGSVQIVELGVAETGATYVVEVELTATSSTLYVYKSGQARSSGYSNVLQTSWSSARLRLDVWNSTNGADQTAYFDNLSQARLIDTDASQHIRERSVYDKEGRKLYDVDAFGQVTEYRYDAGDRVKEVRRYVNPVAPAAVSAAPTAAAVAQLVSAQNPATTGPSAPRVTVYTYDAAGQVESETIDPTGAAPIRTEYGYNKNGNLASKRDANGNVWRYVYDAAGRKVYDIDPLGGLVEYRYDAMDRLVLTTRHVEAIDLNGMPDEMTMDMVRYAAASRLWSSSLTGDSQGLDITPPGPALVYDAVGGRLALTSQPAADVLTIAYGTRPHNIAALGTVVFKAEIQVESSTAGSFYVGAEQPGGNRVHLAQFTGDRIKVYRYNGSNSSAADLGAVEFGAIYVVEVEVTASGTQLSIYKKGQPRSSGFTDAFTATWTTARSRIQTLSTATSANQHAYVDNLAEYVPAVQNASDRMTRKVYDGAGREVYSIDELGYVTESRYRGDGLLKETRRYDAPIGLPTPGSLLTLTGVTTALATAQNAAPDVTAYDYDGAGRLIKRTDANGYFSLTTYDKEGRVLTSTARNGVRTDFTYDANGRQLTQVTDAGSGTSSVTGQAFLNLTTRYEYDNFGRQFRTIDPLNVVTERVYDKLDRVTSQIADTAGKKVATAYEYNRFGERRRLREGVAAVLDSTGWNVTPPALRLTDYDYDSAGRMISETVDSLGSLQIKTEYGYDKLGNLVSRKDANLKTWITAYDETGRKTHDVDPQGGVTEYRYDSFGQLAETLRYAERIVVPAPTTADGLRRAAIAAALLSNNLNANTIGLDLAYANGVIVRQNNRLELTSSTTAAGSVDGAVLRSIVATERLAIRGTVQAPVSGTGAFLLGATGTNGHAASFSNGRIYAYRYPAGGPAEFIDMGALEAGATYVVEVDVGSAGSTLYVYKAGQPRSSGYTDVLQKAWSSARVRTETYASSGALGEKAYVDDISETRILSDASPLTSHERYVYNQAGRPVYKIDALGYVTESKFDGAGRVVETIGYTQPINVASIVGGLTPLSVGTAVSTANPALELAKSHVTTLVYDADGRLVYQIDALNQVTEFRYDKEGRQIDTLRYAQPISITGLPDIMTPDQVRYALVTAVRSSDFGSNSAPINLTGTGMSWASGRIVMTANAAAAPGAADGPANAVGASDRLIIGGELTVTNPTGPGLFQFGAMGNDGRYHLATITGNTLSVRTSTGIGAPVETVLGTVDVGVAYEVEVDITASGSRINIYKTGYPRSSGYTHSFSTGWTSASARLQLTAAANSAGEKVNFDNLVEYRTLADTNAETRRTRTVYDGAGRKVYDIDALGYVTQTRYDAAGRVSETIRHTTAVNHASLAAAPKALDIANLLPTLATWSQDFSVDTAGLTLTPGTGALDLVDGRLRMTVNSSPGLGTTVYGQYTTATTATRIYRAEVQATPVGSSSGFYAGVGNDPATAPMSALRMLYARFVDGKVYAYSYGATYDVIELGQTSSDTVYVVETAVTAAGATLWVYKKGESRSAGYSFTQTVAWDKARFGMLSLGAPSTTSPVAYLDNLSEGLDGIGQRTQYAYDSLGNVISTTDAEGGVESYEYNELGNRTKLINKKGDAWDYGYDAAGRMTYEYAPETVISTRKTNKQGLRVTYYDNSDFTGFSKSDDWTRPVDFNWTGAPTDSAGAPIAGIDADSFSARMSGELQVDVPGNYNFYMAADAGYRLYIDGKLVVGEWNEQPWALDTAWEQINLTAGRHRFVLEYFDVAGSARLALSWEGPGMSSAQNIPASQFFQSTLEEVSIRVTTKIDYDNLGNVIARTEALGTAEQRKTEFKYDALGRQIRTVLPQVGVANVFGAAYGRNETVSAQQTQVFYDAQGRAVASRDQAGNYSYKIYDLLGRVSLEIDEERYVTRYEYDAFGAVTRTTRYKQRIDQEAGDAVNLPLWKREDDADLLAVDTDAWRNAVLATQALAASLASLSGQSAGLLATYYSNSDFSGAQYQRIEAGINPVNEPISGMGTDGYAAVWEGSWEVTQAGSHEFQLGTFNDDQCQLYIDGVLRLPYTGGLIISLAAGRHQFRLVFQHVTQDSVPSLSVTLKAPGDIARPFFSSFVNGLAPADSRTITTEYDKLGRKFRTTQPLTDYYNIGTDTAGLATPITEYGYNRFGDLTSQRSTRNGPADWVTTYFGYDKNGNQVHQVDPMGYYTKQDFDAFGRLVRRQEYALALATVPTSLPDFANFTPPNPLDPSANSDKGYDRITRYVYDRLDRKTEEWLVRPKTSTSSTFTAPPESYADVRSSRIGYDALGNVLNSMDAMGAITTNVYDKLGRLVRTVLPYRSSGSLAGVVGYHTPVIEYDYDALGNRVLEARRANDVGTDVINDQVMELRYDALGRTIEVINANGFSEYYSYNAFGALAKTWNWQTDVMGGTGFSQRTDASTYDRLGRETATSYLLEGSWQGWGSYRNIRMHYNAFGEMVSKGVEDGHEEYYLYDAAGRVRQSNAEGGAPKVYRYDLLGQVVRTEAPPAGSWTPDMVTEYQRDALGRVTLRTDPGLVLNYYGAESDPRTSPTVTQTFDRWGNALKVTDARSYTTEYRYNHLNKITYQKLPAGKAVLSGTAVTNNYAPETYIYYDAVGRQVVVQDARQNVTSVSYDKAGQVVWEYDAYGNAKRHWYDAFGNEIARKDENSNVLLSTYDRLNQLRRTDLQGSSSTPLSLPFYDIYDYDESGNRVSNTNAAGEITRDRYDAHGRIVKHWTPLSYALNDDSLSSRYIYDTLGNKAAEYDANGMYNGWLYNYFGKVLSHSTYDGAAITSAFDDSTVTNVYDSQMRLSTKNTLRNGTSTTIYYQYYQNGWLKQIDDTGGGSIEGYQYDLAGNRAWEYMNTKDIKPATPTWNIRTTNLAYDEQNRVYHTDSNLQLSANEPQTDLVQDILYDQVGNRIKIGTTVIRKSNATDSRDNWYAYDNNNRMTLAEGDGSTGIIKATTSRGVQLGYDAAGNRASEYRYFGNNSHTSNRWTYRTYQYDAANRLINTWLSSLTSSQALGSQPKSLADSREYDAAGRLLQYTEWGVFDSSFGLLRVNDGYTTALGGQNTFYSYQVSDYNANGWLMNQGTYKGVTSSQAIYNPQTHSHSIVYSISGIIIESVVAYGANVANDNFDWHQSVITNQRGWYDKAGNNLRYETQSPVLTTTKFETTYTYLNGYKDALIVRKQGSSEKGRITNTYNNDGNLIKLVDNYGATRTYMVTADGRIVYRQDASDKYQFYFFGNDQLLAAGGTLLGPTYDQNYQPISEQYPASAPGQYIATKDGESLQSIAAAVWGDASLWYLIASANGLGSSADVVAGMVLEIPAQVTNVHNNSETFKPYNPGDAIGSLQPTPKPPKKKCGGLLAAIVVIVAVVVSIWCPIALGMVSWAAGLGGWAAVGAAAAVGAVGAAAGSVASQLTGMALGLQDSFSWSAVGRAAVIGGLTAGLTKGIGGPLLSNIPQGGIGPLSYAGMAQGALNSIVGQGVGIALKQQEKFSWSSLAASVVMSGMGDKINAKLGINSENISNASVRDFVGGAVSGVTSRTIQVALAGKGKIDLLNIAADAFGNVLGNSIGATIEKGREDRKWEALKQRAQAMGDGLTAEGIEEARTSGNFSAKQIEQKLDDVAAYRTEVAARPGTAGVVDEATASPGVTTDSSASPPSGAAAPMSSAPYTVKKGDTITKIAGKDPAKIGLFMASNGMKNSMLRIGDEVTIGDLSQYSEDQIANFRKLGEAVLKQDNARIAALRAEAERQSLAAAAATNSPVDVGDMNAGDGGLDRQSRLALRNIAAMEAAGQAGYQIDRKDAAYRNSLGPARGEAYGTQRSIGQALDPLLEAAQEALHRLPGALDDAGAGFAADGNMIMTGVTAAFSGVTRLGVDVFSGGIGIGRLFTNDEHMAAMGHALMNPRETVSYGIEAFANAPRDRKLLTVAEFIGFGGVDLLATAGRATLNVAVDTARAGRTLAGDLNAVRKFELDSASLGLSEVDGLGVGSRNIGAESIAAPAETVPGMSRPFRPVNPKYPPNQSALEAMNGSKIQGMADDIRVVDCSEIAESLHRAANGRGAILEAQPSKLGNLNVYEKGSVEPGQWYHQVYTDGRYVFDPRLSTVPVPKGDWMQHMRGLNPDGITITNKPKGLR
ncbi:LysM peptidoglycan-binding domain-containing protein [Solimonas sp. K1W22B-7]|uniref:PA14 domain-containing protein n=1 Tax=Solimonas sp. K1W22B-7 TaxID=2303331 RepID=UPI000E32D869|nr:PA14 domain-containing protein [Solimonas sp. K1W22B-7]AXQ28043.1 LysM peptidoglycan-binding domain-containing protein [Solimonas sp. K1W22B-7]